MWFDLFNLTFKATIKEPIPYYKRKMKRIQYSDLIALNPKILLLQLFSPS